MINDSAATCSSLVKVVEEFTVQITSFLDVSGQQPLLAVVPRLRRLLRGKINFELLVIVNVVGGIIPVRHSVTDAADVVQLYPGP